MSQNPNQEELRDLLLGTRTIAMVGASSNPERPSNGVMRKLLSAGYRVIPVNPNETEVLGQRAYPSLEAIPEKVDLVDVFRRSDATPPIAEQAVRIGARALWLQQGVVNDQAAETAQRGGLIVAMDLCIAVMHTLLGIPKK
jgi:predicted CoA-binding protein